jgi:phage gpG-like protein
MANGYEVKGLRETELYIKGLDKAIQAKLAQAVQVTAELARADLVDRLESKIRPHLALRGRKGGKRIRRIVNDLFDTGTLARSWQVNRVDADTVEVATNVKYAAPLEYGTKDGKITGFFYVRDTVQFITPRYRKRCEEALKQL